jgi:hypothetical protein
LRRRLLAVVVCAAALACNDHDSVPAGTWGGRNAVLAVTASGATAQFKCGATGTISVPLRLHASTFDVPGTYRSLLVNAGPQPARFAGSVSGSSMTLDVTVGGQSIGTFALTMGTAPSFDVCNF